MVKLDVFSFSIRERHIVNIATPFRKTVVKTKIITTIKANMWTKMLSFVGKLMTIAAWPSRM
jgi:hypothetical protein